MESYDLKDINYIDRMEIITFEHHFMTSLVLKSMCYKQYDHIIEQLINHTNE
jgi:hypothetical protein